MAYAQITLFGNMGKGAVYKEAKSGTGYLKFSIAVNQYDSATREQKPSWFNCQMWDNQKATRLEKLRPYLEGDAGKGKQLLIVGTPNIWQDTDGNNVLTVKVNELSFGSKDQTREVEQDDKITFNAEEPPF